MEWQKIETAPKDGTVIKVRQDNLAPCHAYWENGWKYIEYQHCHHPTSWMPLPKAPE